MRARLAALGAAFALLATAAPVFAQAGGGGLGDLLAGIGCGLIVFGLVAGILFHAGLVFVGARVVGLDGGFGAAIVATLVGVALLVVGAFAAQLVGLGGNTIAQSLGAFAIMAGAETTAIKGAFKAAPAPSFLVFLIASNLSLIFFVLIMIAIF